MVQSHLFLAIRSVFLGTISGTLILLSSGALAAKAVAAPVPVPGNYCGVYCVYGACRVLGVPVKFPELLRSRYVGSVKGSTFAELSHAIHDHSLDATLVRRLDISALDHCRWPVILHVRSEVEESTPNHFILYLGEEDGGALIMDPPTAPDIVSFRRIAALWDGKGIIVSDKPISAFALFGYSYFQFAALAIVLMSLAVILRLTVRVGRRVGMRSQYLGWTLTQAVAILTLAVLVGTVANVIGRGGLLAPSRQSRELQRIYSGQMVHRAGFAMANAMVRAGVPVIDARFASDYDRGHIPGAINIPPGTAPQSRRQLLRGANVAGRVMVYCEDSGCPLAEPAMEKQLECGHCCGRSRSCWRRSLDWLRRWDPAKQSNKAPAVSLRKFRPCLNW